MGDMCVVHGCRAQVVCQSFMALALIRGKVREHSETIEVNFPKIIMCGLGGKLYTEQTPESVGGL